MTTNPTPNGVTTHVDENSVSATAVVDASPQDVFDFIRRPANHAEISGDGTVRSDVAGPEALGPDSRFGMKMKWGVPYRTTSKVVEFDEDRVIAWCHLSGHRWRWKLEPTPDGKTALTETYDQSTAKVPLLLKVMGYPQRHLSNVAGSVANVAAHFENPSPGGVRGRSPR